VNITRENPQGTNRRRKGIKLYHMGSKISDYVVTNSKTNRSIVLVIEK
jgi:hypothetical protein